MTEHISMNIETGYNEEIDTWQATFEGYEEGDIAGYGPTEVEAIQMLLYTFMEDEKEKGNDVHVVLENDDNEHHEFDL